MAKGRVTEEELSASLQSIGGLGSFSGGGTRRDSPFGSAHVKSSRPKGSDRVSSGEVADAEGRPAEPAEEAAAVESAALMVQMLPEVRPKQRKAVSPVEEQQRRADSPIEEQQRKASPPVEAALESRRKADHLTERVTLQMSPEMRDEVNSLATRLQRQRTEKVERITANTVMRVAIQTLLDKFEPQPGEAVNTEVELLALAKRKLRQR